MKFITDKNSFLNGVNIVSKAIPTNTTMEILKNIKINANNGLIKLLANDMDLAIETIIEGEVLEQGEVAVSANYLNTILRGLPDNKLIIETKDNVNLCITYNEEKGSNSNIKYVSTDEFPDLPPYEKDNFIKLSQFSLKELIRTTIFSIADNETNKIMTGELFEVKGNELKVVSLDGHRISIRKTELKDTYNDISVIVPGKALKEVIKVLNNDIDNDVTVYINKNNIVFEFDNNIIISRLIEGDYFKIDHMLSSNYTVKVDVNKKELLDGINRAVPFVHEGEKKPVKFNFEGDSLNMSIVSMEGGNNDYINIDKEGNDVLIGFNPKFIIDALKVIDDETVSLYMINSKAPCFIKNETENYIYLILPVNL